MRQWLVGWVMIMVAGTASAAEERVLLHTERHAVTAQYEGDQVTFVMEALQDTSDDLSGSFPRLDFAGVRVDVDQNGRVDRGTDLHVGVAGGTRDRVCTQYYESSNSYSGCGEATSTAGLSVSFEATALASQPHPVWRFQMPARELTQRGKVAHVAFQFHEAGRGYTHFPEGGRSNHPFATVIRVPLVPPGRILEAIPMREYRKLEGGRNTLVELLRNDRHVISARRGRGKTTFVLEAIGDTTDDLRGTYPDLDFASVRVDVDQDLAVSPNVDSVYGAKTGSSDEICSQFFLSASTWSGCGARPSAATMRARFEATASEAAPHPVWRFTIPNAELSRGNTAHLVFRFFESGGGYTVYPQPEDANQPFSRVAAIHLKTLMGGVRPEIPAEDAEVDEPEVIVHDTTPPTITLTEPGPADARISLDAKTVRVAGSAADENGLFEIQVDGQDASVAADGTFWADRTLAIGENQIRVRASDTNGNWSEAGITVVRESADAPPPADGGDSRGLDTPEVVLDDLTDGTYHALLIAVQDYADDSLQDLDKPIADARRLEQVLLERYQFDAANVTVVENPTESDVFAALQTLGEAAGPDDSVLVFYAGHGTWNEQISQGYWLPADASSGNPAQWISNGDIRDLILGLGAKHTLLISDACFSGGLFKTRSAFTGADRAVQELHRLASRKAMTSGTLTEVPDESVFLKYLLDRLETSTSQWTTADALFADFRQAVINNSPNTPQYGVIFEAGDEGGEFVFVRK